MDGKELKIRRENLGLSINALAKLLDVQPSSIMRWEAGSKIKSPAMLDYALQSIEREHTPELKVGAKRKAASK